MSKLDKIIREFKDYFKNLDSEAEIKIKLGAELEFYYDCDLNLSKNHENIKKITKLLKAEDLIDELEEEEGESQFEINFKVEEDGNLLVKKINRVKEILTENNCILSTKPKFNNPFNALHINVSLFLDDVNLFQKNPLSKDYSIFFYQSIGGLLELMNESVYIFAPFEECYGKFLPPKNEVDLLRYLSNCSWGFNNRTTAIRIPTFFSKMYPDCRIEHRLCSPLANVEDCLFVVLYSMLFGIKNFIKPSEPVFGNAFSYENDHLPGLPKTFNMAKKFFDKGRIKIALEEYLS